MKSKLTKNQKKEIVFKNKVYNGEKVDLIINLRYDDKCRNGHNTFSIAGDLYKAGLRSDRNIICGGCIHDIIEELAPEYKPYIKWHLTSSDGPMHYAENTLYLASKIEKYNYYVYFKDPSFKISKLVGIYAANQTAKLLRKYPFLEKEKRPDSSNKDPQLESARISAIAPDATLEQLQNKEWLINRIPQLQKEFKQAMESLGFVY